MGLEPEAEISQLIAGERLERSGNLNGALWAYFKSVTGAQLCGYWLDEDSTPDEHFGLIVHAIEKIRSHKKDIFYQSYEDLRAKYGAKSLERVDKALAAHLREIDCRPQDARQKPRFFYFPDLPNTTFHDPLLHPWALELQNAFPTIRGEALNVWGEDKKFQNFLDLSDRTSISDYVRGDGTSPAWEAYFFYRHGRRFDENHKRCPKTSKILDTLDLCRIADQAPEICFSVLKPGTHLLPHHGVTNIRLVMHLPLVVPDQCALHLTGEQEHRWKEGKTVMFDDTFQHEAWNRSEQSRIVLLMDCWNPHLTRIERMAVKKLLETISTLNLANRARPKN
jgi:aspartate beta-hydroxylase